MNNKNNTRKRAAGWLCGLLFLFSSTASYAGNSVVDNIIASIGNFWVHLNEARPNTNLDDTPQEERYPQSIENPGIGVLGLLPNLAGPVLDGNLDGFLLYFFLYAEIPQAEWDFGNYVELPQIPAVNRPVVGVTEKGGFTKPHIPPLRWTADGRLGVNSQVGGFPYEPYPVQLYLIQPEAQEKPFLDSAPGPQTLVLDVTELPFRSLSPEKGGLIQHTNICDPFYVDSDRRPNPYACGVNGEDDCYDVTLISGLTDNGVDVPPGGTFNAQLAEWDRVMGTPLHIRVTNPKTTNAQIAEVQYGEPKYAPNRSGVLFETITPADGRLLVARRAYMPLLWQNDAKNKAQLGSYDLVYSVAPPEAEPCEVSYWTEFYPMTHAPYDERVSSRYLFAKQPFRDPTGEVIPDGADMKGTYPWMDKEAKIFSFQTSPGTLFPTYKFNRGTKSRFPVRCVSQDDCSVDNMSDTDISQDNVFAILGAWTQGKMVLLDGLLNDVDYRIGIKDINQSYLSLYQPNTGDDNHELTGENSGEVRIGGTRIVTTQPIDVPVFNEDGSLKGQYRPRNTSMFDSIENRFNYLENFQHTKPDDVVWITSSGHSTVEFAFDDYLKPDGFIVSNMVGLMKWRNNNWYKMTYYDGWNPLLQKFSSQVRVQNSATATPDRWNLPEYGRVRNGRLEPVANGGIRGKGIWFNGNNTRIEYRIGEQPQSIQDRTWFYSLFIDPRDSEENIEATLIRFPNGSEITMTGNRLISLYDINQYEVHRFALPEFVEDHQWLNLSFSVHTNNGNSATQFFINGFPYAEWSGSTSSNFFLPSKGTLTLGYSRSRHTTGFKGWMDEFKVFASEPDLESVCNTAHGTLTAVTDSLGEQDHWRTYATNFASSQHAKVSEELALYGQETFESYVCYHDYTADNKAHLKNIPDGLTSIKSALQFPEGPLYHDTARPDSTTNDFCLSCHHDNGVVGLTVDALRYANIPAKLDRRRQPSQPPAKVYGVIPEGWLPNSEASGGSESGILIDEWVLPSMEGEVSKVLNVVIADADGIALRKVESGEAISINELISAGQQLKVTTNGITRQVVVSISSTISESEMTLDRAPFTFSANSLSEGHNSLTIVGQLGGGDESEPFEISLVVE
ncbi:MAG: hypothetical protein MI867_22035 [Pseudomonadales bacterium]|nr:hypothetical protein [Pseudomonadales bacterium]